MQILKYKINYIIIMENETFFKQCFDKHNFQELNNIDVRMLYNVFNYHIQKFPIQNNSIYFDVGTNAGSFLKILTHFKIYSNIHCFEPHPVISKKTKSAYQNVIMNEICLSNNKGEVTINFPLHSVGLSSMIDRPVFNNLGTEVKKITVKSETLDQYCNSNNINNIDFIKIDVEGAEKMIIEGADNMLKNKKIKAGIFEIGETLKDAGTSEEEIATILERYGYNIVKNLSRNDWYFHI
jgi:FkbM family methyltransferase